MKHPSICNVQSHAKDIFEPFTNIFIKNLTALALCHSSLCLLVSGSYSKLLDCPLIANETCSLATLSKKSRHFFRLSFSRLSLLDCEVFPFYFGTDVLHIQNLIVHSPFLTMIPRECSHFRCFHRFRKLKPFLNSIYLQRVLCLPKVICASDNLEHRMKNVLLRPDQMSHLPIRQA